MPSCIKKHPPVVWHVVTLWQTVLAFYLLEGMNEVMASLDIFLLNSYREAFGFVIVEAMMSGTSVIATNSGGVPDVLGEGKFGLLVPPKDTMSLASAFSHLSRNEEFRKSLSEKAREYALKEFDEDKNFEKLLEVVNHIRRTP